MRGILTIHPNIPHMTVISIPKNASKYRRPTYSAFGWGRRKEREMEYIHVFVGKGVAVSVVFIMNLTITLQEEEGECVYTCDETAFPQWDPA